MEIQHWLVKPNKTAVNERVFSFTCLKLKELKQMQMRLCIFRDKNIDLQCSKQCSKMWIFFFIYIIINIQAYMYGCLYV